MDSLLQNGPEKIPRRVYPTPYYGIEGQKADIQNWVPEIITKMKPGLQPGFNYSPGPSTHGLRQNQTLGGRKPPRSPRVDSRRISYTEGSQDGVKARASTSVVTGTQAGFCFLPCVIHLAQRFPMGGL